MNTAEVQRILIGLGYDLGAAGADGVFGVMTRRAIKAFQISNQLQGLGVVGPKTTALLEQARAKTPPAPFMPWFEEATRYLGLKEIAGKKSNAIILDWADDLDLHYAGDDVPWCGLFVAHCISSTLPDEPLPANPLGARNWEKFGEDSDPGLGAVMVFWRGSRSGWAGHVGFYVAESKTSFKIRGGNQSNSVSDAWISKDRLLKARKPVTSALIGEKILVSPAGAPLSRNEQ